MIFITFIYIILNLNYAITNMSIVLVNFFKNLLPYLFLFLIVNQLLIKTNIILIFGYFLQLFLYPLFKINAKTCSLLLISLINGFPSSVLYSSIMVKENKVEANTTHNIAKYFFLPSFSFVFFIIYKNLTPLYFNIFLLSLYLPSFFFLLFYREKSQENYIKINDVKFDILTSFNQFNYINDLKSIFIETIYTLINILGMISFYSIITLIIPFNFIKGLFEFSIPSLSILSSNSNDLIKSLQLLIILVFSSFSSISQATIYLKDINLTTSSFIKTRIALLSLSIIIFILCIFVFFL